jgi:hypothetical protein
MQVVVAVGAASPPTARAVELAIMAEVAAAAEVVAAPHPEGEAEAALLF